MHYTYLDSIRQRFFIVSLVLPLNLNHINLTSSHHQSDQLSVVRSQAFHALIQLFSEERCLVLYRPYHRQEPLLGVTRKLIFNRLFNIVSGDPGIFLEYKLQLTVVTLAQHHVEGGFVCSETQFSGSQESLCVGLGGLGIHYAALVPAGIAEGHHEAFEGTSRVAF